MLFRTSFSLVLVLVLLSASDFVRGDVLSFEPQADNTIYAESNELSNALGNYLFVGNTASAMTRRALVSFDVSAIPSGSTVNSVTLQMYMSRTRGGSESVLVHRLTASWGEGTSVAGGSEGGGGTATTNDATWKHRFYVSSTWGNNGGDFIPTASASTLVGGNGFYNWSGSGLVSDVQAWVNSPSSSPGWILIGNEVAGLTAKRFESRHTSNVSRRPLLTVDFTPPGMTGACCFGDGSCQLLTQGNCLGQGGSYQGDGVSCSPNPCPQPTGACCLGDGTCIVTSDPNCVGQGGSYQGDGVPCDPNLCPIPTGACCLDDGTCLDLSLADCLASGGSYQGNGAACTPRLCPINLTPFVDALPIPPVATPTSGVAGGAATYDITMLQVEQQLHRDLPPTTLWTYDGIFPGPTIEAASDQPVTVNWINDLREPNGALRSDHYLPVETCIHGGQDLPKTVVHLHGGHVPAAFDGYPEFTYLPGFFDSYLYPNHQLPSMLWYHDHALGITRLNVYMGLAGAYIIRDAFEAALNLPDGPHEVPLIIQDRSFNPDGSLYYPDEYVDHFFGEQILVNGKVWPYLDVEQGKYRLRVLNGCNARTLTLSLSNGATFQKIGTDGGLLPAPLTVSEVTLGGAERADLVIDFAGYAAGTEILLVNSAPAPYPGTPGVGVVPDVLKFVVQGTPGDVDPLPGALRPLESLDPNEAVEARDFVLQRVSDPTCTGNAWLINGLHWGAITEYPALDTIETWRFINRSGMSHPMHMHLVFFQVVSTQAFTVVDDEVVPVGSPQPPSPAQQGWRDTVEVPPGQMVTVIARFEDYQGLFAYHCHILEHEDHEMMRQFRAIFPGDTDGDCDVDLSDLANILSAFGESGSGQPGDVDFDGDVDLSDLALVLGAFGASCL